MSLLPPDYDDRQEPFNEFLVCPKCEGGGDATLEINEGFDAEDVTDYRMKCWDCGHESPWLLDKAPYR